MFKNETEILVLKRKELKLLQESYAAHIKVIYYCRDHVAKSKIELENEKNNTLHLRNDDMKQSCGEVRKKYRN